MRKLITGFLVSAVATAGLALPAQAADTRTCAQGGTCVVGDIGPGGGVVFYARTPGAFSESLMRQIDCDEECLDLTVTVSATSDEITALTFDYLEVAPSSAIRELPQAGTDLTSGTFTALGTGQANTNVFLRQFPDESASNNASHFANGYANAGVDDWFLPSEDELALLVLRHLKSELGASDSLPGSGLYFWSSTDSETFFMNTNNFYKHFGGNSTQVHSVIPIRAFSSNPLPATPTVEPVKPSTSTKISFTHASAKLTKVSKAKLKKLAGAAGTSAEIFAVVSVGRIDGVSNSQLKKLAKLRVSAIKKYLNRISTFKKTFKIKIIESGIKPITKVTVF